MGNGYVNMMQPSCNDVSYLPPYTEGVYGGEFMSTGIMSRPANRVDATGGVALGSVRFYSDDVLIGSVGMEVDGSLGCCTRTTYTCPPGSYIFGLYIYCAGGHYCASFRVYCRKLVV